MNGAARGAVAKSQGGDIMSSKKRTGTTLSPGIGVGGVPVARVALAALAALVASGGTALVAESPDAEFNETEGLIETVYESLDGGDTDIRHAFDRGPGAPVVSSVLTMSGVDDRRPRIGISVDGEAGVVWWRDGNVSTVLFRSRDHALGKWMPIRVLSDPEQPSRFPEIAGQHSNFWIAYEFDVGDGTRSVAIQHILDDPEPFPTRTIVDTTPFPGALLARPHVEGDAVWATWVFDEHDIGWSEYDAASGTWSPAAYEPYADGVEPALQRIRDRVTEDDAP